MKQCSSASTPNVDPLPSPNSTLNAPTDQPSPTLRHAALPAEAIEVDRGRRASTDQKLFLRLKRWQWWLLMAVNILFLLTGQAAGVLLGRFYFDKGGNSAWLATVVQTAGFPVLYLPYFLLPSSPASPNPNSPPSLTTVSLIYLALGVLVGGDNMLYSMGLRYLSASTYSLVCATQLAFNTVFSFFINSHRLTALVLNSVVVLSISASLLAVNGDSDSPRGVAGSKYAVGFACALAASALYSLILSLMQLCFQKVLKKESFSVVFEMQIYTSLVATAMSVVGLLASGDWRTMRGEMGAFGTGKASYVMTLVWTAVSWQVCAVGLVGLIFMVSSLYSNVISTLSLAVTPLAAMAVFREGMNGVKVIALLTAFWGFATYVYQNYLDDSKARKTRDGVLPPH